MLKREITFEDFNGEKVTETLWFHLSKSEMIEMDANHEGGLEATIKRIMKTNDRQGLVREFQNLLLLAYGQKSEDGRKFIKSDALREEFKQTAAYDAMFMELATDDKAAANFMKGILPKDMAAEVARLDNETPTAPNLPLPAPNV